MSYGYNTRSKTMAKSEDNLNDLTVALKGLVENLNNPEQRRVNNTNVSPQQLNRISMFHLLRNHQKHGFPNFNVGSKSIDMRILF
jgi:hypothetical protein